MDFFTAVDEHYGVDDDGPEPDLEDSGVEVPQLSYQIGAHDLHRLKDTVDPLTVSDNFGIDLYHNALQFINQL